MKHIPYRDNPENYMKAIPLQGEPSKLYEIHTTYRDNPEIYIKNIPLQGEPCKLYEIHPQQGQP